METTFEKIKKHLPCENGWERLINFYNPKNLKEKVTIEEIIKSNGILDAVWALRCIEDEAKLKKVYLFCADVAEYALDIFEKKYPDDNRPRKAIEAVRLFVASEISVNELRVAHLEAYSAYRYALDNGCTDAALAAKAASAATIFSAYVTTDAVDLAYSIYYPDYSRKKRLDKIKEFLIKYLK